MSKELTRKCRVCNGTKAQKEFQLLNPEKPHFGYSSNCNDCKGLESYYARLKQNLKDDPQNYWQCSCGHIMNKKIKNCTKCNKEQA